MLDRALAKMFSELSTLILVACVFTVPIHLGHAYIFKNELSVREMGAEIAALDEGQRVLGVDAADVGEERMWLTIVVMVELAASVLVFRAAKRVFSMAQRGGVPGVVDAYKHLGQSSEAGLPPATTVAILVAIAGTAASLLLVIGTRIADMAPADVAWIGVGTARAVAMAVFLALAAGGAAALPGRTNEAARPAEKLDLY